MDTFLEAEAVEAYPVVVVEAAVVEEAPSRVVDVASSPSSSFPVVVPFREAPVAAPPFLEEEAAIDNFCRRSEEVHGST